MIEEWPKNFDKKVIRAIRGNKSMSWLSHRLGYSFNQVYLWESGKRVFYWKDFENICHSLKRPLSQNVKDFFHEEDPFKIESLLKRSLGPYKNKEIAKAMGITTSKLSRWVTGKSNPPFLEVCKILSFTQLNFHEFLDEVIGCGKLEIIQSIVSQKVYAKKALDKKPYIASIAPALGLSTYKNLKKHRADVLAKKLGLTVEEVNEGLKILLDLGQVHKENNLYKLKSYRVNTSNNRETFLKNCQYWSERAAKIKKNSEMKSLFGFRVFGISSQGYQKLREAQLQYYDEISKILKDEDGPFEHTIAVNFQTMVLEDK